MSGPVTVGLFRLVMVLELSIRCLLSGFSKIREDTVGGVFQWHLSRSPSLKLVRDGGEDVLCQVVAGLCL